MKKGEFITDDIKEYCKENLSVNVYECSCKPNFVSIYPVDGHGSWFSNNFCKAMAYIESETGHKVRTFSYHISRIYDCSEGIVIYEEHEELKRRNPNTLTLDVSD